MANRVGGSSTKYKGSNCSREYRKPTLSLYIYIYIYIYIAEKAKIVSVSENT